MSHVLRDLVFMGWRSHCVGTLLGPTAPWAGRGIDVLETVLFDAGLFQDAGLRAKGSG